jgi:hypothetical protein
MPETSGFLEWQEKRRGRRSIVGASRFFKVVGILLFVVGYRVGI